MKKIEINLGNSLLPSLLLVLFIGLKLTGYITWSWIWVLAPFWIPAGFALLMMSLVVLAMLFAAIIKSR